MFYNQFSSRAQTVLLTSLLKHGFRGLQSISLVNMYSAILPKFSVLDVKGDGNLIESDFFVVSLLPMKPHC